MIKQKPVYVCDRCGAEMAIPAVTTEDVANEGASTIRVGKRSFDVGGQHYCSVLCLLSDIRAALEE